MKSVAAGLIRWTSSAAWTAPSRRSSSAAANAKPCATPPRSRSAHDLGHNRRYDRCAVSVDDKVGKDGVDHGRDGSGLVSESSGRGINSTRLLSPYFITWQKAAGGARGSVVLICDRKVSSINDLLPPAGAGGQGNRRCLVAMEVEASRSRLV